MQTRVERRRKSELMKDNFLSALETIQQIFPRLISKQLDVNDDFGLSRSGRRGATAKATNTPNEECNDADVKRIN